VPRFDYPCPDCRTRNSLHDADCRFEGVAWPHIENAYLDVVAPLSTGVVAESDLIAGWPDDDRERLRRAVLGRLKTDGRADEAGGRLRLRTAAEYREEVAEPDVEPIRTVYRDGSVPGCHDNAVFAMIAWYEMVGLSRACRRVVRAVGHVVSRRVRGAESRGTGRYETPRLRVGLRLEGEGAGGQERHRCAPVTAARGTGRTAAGVWAV